MHFLNRSFSILRQTLSLKTSISANAVAYNVASFSSDATRKEGSTVVGRCKTKITAALQPTRLVVNGNHDDPNGSHIRVEVVSAAFEGKNTVMRQRMVYKALWDEMSAGGQLHAVDSIIAKTPAEDKSA